MPPKSVVSLLTQQSEETLVEMRDGLRAEIAGLEIEANLVDEALSKRYRRGTRSAARGDTNGRNRQLTRKDVLDLVQTHGYPVTPAETRALFADRGIHVSGNSIRNHLARLASDGKLKTNGEGLYFPPGRETDRSDERLSADQTDEVKGPDTIWNT